MKRSLFFGLAGLLALVLMAGCNSATSPSTPAYVGTWKASDSNFSYTLVLTTSTFSFTDKVGTSSTDAQGPFSGTLSVNGSNMTFTQTSGGTATETDAYSVSGSTLHIASGTYTGVSSGNYTKS